MKEQYFVYVLRSLVAPEKTYVGFSTRPDERLVEHNTFTQTYSSRSAPWERIACIAFARRSVALAFERYLKTPSGKAFLKKHVLEGFES
ncbi:MAG TPA: GIY-YIG nuclease family protein [Kiritimatiellia bacterium]|nr:GIY-YIG nuclease family protein [Kiritimatiellia bacterium]HRZ12548.1 GIY-YIG nuclease family protein [Kiritimatiellia bacterium]HSA17626.1 GIY-YIG nuclease family protein [Kiritimatiellia bacterium]